MEEDEIKNFKEAISHLSPWIKEKIGESKDKKIAMKVVDFFSKIDSRLAERSNRDVISLYDQTRFLLSKEGIWVTIGHTIGDDIIYIMRLLQDKREFVERQIQELDVEIGKLKEHIQTVSIDQLPDDIIEYLGERIV